MATDSNQPALAPVTLEAFSADRERFLNGFWTAATWGAGAVIVLLILMAIFLT